MKISKINPLLSGHKTDRTKSSSTDFKNLFESQLNSVSASIKAAPGDQVQSVSSPDPLIRLEGLALTEKTINILDSFGAALNNPALSNDDLKPFISTMEENTSAIADLRQQLKPEDPLAVLLDNVAAVTSLETAKYNRGDYAI